MTEKELRKLSRVELLKLLVEVTEENEMLRAQLQGQQELVQRAQIQDSREVRESVEDVFRTVESTATGFLSKAQGIADQIMEDARVRAEGIIRDAEAQAARYTETQQSLPPAAEPAEEASSPPYEPFTAAAPQMQQVIEEIALEQSPEQSAEDAFAKDALFEGTNATEVTARRLTEVRVTIPEPVAVEEEEDTAEPEEAFADLPEAEIAAEPEPEDIAEPEAAVSPEEIVPQDDGFRIEGLEDTAPQARPADEAAAPLTKPLTAIDLLKRMQGGG